MDHVPVIVEKLPAIVGIVLGGITSRLVKMQPYFMSHPDKAAKHALIPPGKEIVEVARDQKK